MAQAILKSNKSSKRHKKSLKLSPHNVRFITTNVLQNWKISYLHWWIVLHYKSKISFTHTKSSAYQFKRQPFAEALSTMESTLCVLETLTNQKLETISDEKLKTFIEPFEKMVESQMKFVSSQPRFKKI